MLTLKSYQVVLCQKNDSDVQYHTEMLCNYLVRSADFILRTYFVITFLGRKACNSDIRYFTFHISTKEMNMLVRLVRYVNFWCHFMSEVARDNRWLLSY